MKTFVITLETRLDVETTIFDVVFVSNYVDKTQTFINNISKDIINEGNYTHYLTIWENETNLKQLYLDDEIDLVQSLNKIDKNKKLLEYFFNTSNENNISKEYLTQTLNFINSL